MTGCAGAIAETAGPTERVVAGYPARILIPGIHPGRIFAAKSGARSGSASGGTGFQRYIIWLSLAGVTEPLHPPTVRQMSAGELGNISKSARALLKMLLDLLP